MEEGSNSAILPALYISDSSLTSFDDQLHQKITPKEPSGARQTLSVCRRAGALLFSLDALSDERLHSVLTHILAHQMPNKG